MNILILSWRGPGHPNAGGAEISTLEHAKGWIKSGHTVTWFTSNYIHAKATETIDGVTVIRQGRQTFEVHLKAFFWYLFSRKQNFDLVVDQFHGIPFFTPIYIRTKKIAFIHEVTKDIWSFNPWPKPLNLIPSVIGGIFEPLIFKLFYKQIPFLTVSESTKTDLIEFGILNKNITVIHNGFDRKYIAKKSYIKSKTKTAIFLGAISWDKGIVDALQIFKRIYEKDKSWNFWVVGKSSPDLKKFLKKEITGLGIVKKTKYWGFVSDKKKFDLLGKAHVLVNPSVREGWGLVNIEANAVGTPVVAYSVAGSRDSVRNNVSGKLVDRSNLDKMVDAVMFSANNKKLQASSKEWSRKFSWTETANKSCKYILKIYNSKR